MREGFAMKHIFVTAVVAAVTVAIIWRVASLRKIVVGA
jgi:hypothetical protein